jgi:GPH family glycoside/pentoside/hexuronide:cation symporter
MMTTNLSQRSLSHPITLLTRLAYGVGDFGPSMAGSTLMVFFFFFLTTVAGLSPDRAGLILCLSQGWSAVSTLCIGALSDRTQSSWGRRRIWLLSSAPILGLSFWLHWWVPPGGEWLRFSYFLLMALLFQTAGNAFTIPYGALLTDLSDRHDEHICLNGFRFGFSLSGCILSLLLAQGMDRWISQPQQRVFNLGLIGAIVIVLSILSCCWGVKEAPSIHSQAQPRNESPQQALQTWWQLLYNRPLLLLAGIYAGSWLALQITPTLLPYFIVYCLQLDSSAIPQLVLLMQGTALAMLFLWERLSQAIGKRLVFWAGTSLWILAALQLLDLRPGQTSLLYMLSVLIGFGMSTVYLIPLSLLPEVAAIDEQHTGNRREGLLYSVLVFLQKIALAIGLLFVGQLLASADFQQAVPGPIQLVQPTSALAMIRALTAFIPVLSLLASLWLMSLYEAYPNSSMQKQLRLQLVRVSSQSK